MQPPGLPLHLAFRRSLGADHAGDWDATQTALARYANARARRATWLRLLLWGSVLFLVLGSIALVFGAGPAWLDFRLFALFVVVGLSQIELGRLRQRLRPWLLSELAPKALPETAWAFMKPFREGEQVAYWDDKRGQTRRIPVGMMEPPETLLLLSDGPELRVIGLPWPLDMDQPDVVVPTETSEPALSVARQDVPDDRAVLTDTGSNTCTEVALPAETIMVAPTSTEYERGVIRRDWTIYRQPFEQFRAAVAKQFDPAMAGPSQVAFHALLAIYSVTCPPLIPRS